MSPANEAEQRWFAAHTKPRCEKKLQAWCQQEGLDCRLPTYASVRQYRGKEVTFHKPLFPGYLFIGCPGRIGSVLQSDYVANLLEPPNQAEFETQLNDILIAVESMETIRLVPNIGPGTRVLGISTWDRELAGDF